MSDAPLEERLAAVERALTDGEDTAPDLTAPDRGLVDRVGTLEEDVAELEAAVQAVRGYVGSVKHVNDEVEQRADAAMAKVEVLERTVAQDVGAGSGRRKRRDGPEGTAAHVGDDAGSTDSETGCCPRCGAGQSGQGPRSRLSQDPEDTVQSDGGASDVAGRESDRAVEARGPRRNGRRREGEHGNATGDAPGGRPPAGGDACDRPAGVAQVAADSPGVTSDGDPERLDFDGPRVGHRHLEAPDEPDGLLARLKEVL